MWVKQYTFIWDQIQKEGEFMYDCDANRKRHKGTGCVEGGRGPSIVPWSSQPRVWDVSVIKRCGLPLPNPTLRVCVSPPTLMLPQWCCRKVSLINMKGETHLSYPCCLRDFRAKFMHIKRFACFVHVKFFSMWLLSYKLISTADF